MKWFLAVLAVVAIGAGGAWKWKSDRDYTRKWGAIEMPERFARIMKPLSPQQLAPLLQEGGKVRDAGAFIEAAQQSNLKQIAVGGYQLPKSAGPRELAKVFQQAPTHAKVTFPEGWIGKQIASRLRGNNFKNADEFYRTVYPPGKNASPWEGRLFPDTYYLPKNGGAKQIIGIMTTRFQEVMSGIATSAKKHPRGANNQKLTAAQVIVLASLVERETDIPEERPLVAGVLVSRLQKKMRLQCDASVQYARVLAEAQGKLPVGHKERLLYKDLWLKSPYNTYRNAGLPPGAICNPSKSSLRAALEPKMTNNLFYVWSPKFKKHRFAPTFAEHIKNKNLAAQERKAGA